MEVGTCGGEECEECLVGKKMQMAMQEASPAAPTPSAQIVGHAFVTQYYHILHQSPEYVYKFYQDTSSLSRPDSTGVMTSVTTMQAINDKILSFGFGNQKAEIETADALESYKDGVIVLVTGCFTRKDNVRRKFAQTFFLAPQEKGYFVLNDVLRYVDTVTTEVNSVSANNVAEDTHVALPPLDPEPTLDSDHPPEPAESFDAEVLSNNAEVYDHSDHEDGSLVDEEVCVEPPTHPNSVEANTVATSDSFEPQEKKSYASIVKVTKVARASAPIYVPTNRTKVVPANTDQPVLGTTKPSPDLEASHPDIRTAPESATTHEEGHSIYIRNLPLSTSIEQLEEGFKKFGPIKSNGIQVKNSKQHGYCFGFVEFKTLDSMHAAIQASPVTIGDRESVVEEKRATRGGGSGTGRYSSGRGGFRSESFRGRGNFSWSRGGYGRQEISRGPGGGRGGEGYRRVDQRGGHDGGTNKSFASGERT